MKQRTAYLIMVGNGSGRTVSVKLRARCAIKRSVKAAKRLGFKDAYAASVRVNADCKLIGELV